MCLVRVSFQMRWNFNPPNKVAATGLSPAHRKTGETDKQNEYTSGRADGVAIHRENVENNDKQAFGKHARY